MNGTICVKQKCGIAEKKNEKATDVIKLFALGFSRERSKKQQEIIYRCTGTNDADIDIHRCNEIYCNE